jgi:hemerythrin-like domain-containing protein
MGAIEILMSEHRTIERAIDALTAFADEILRGSDDKAELGRFVTFIREFADECHHGKEEGILFQAMVDAGFPREGGPIAVMLMEHDMGRAHVKELARLAGQAELWSAGDREKIADEAIGYGNLLRAHIHKEDAILYPMAEQRLSPDVLARVDEACEAYERQKTGAGGHEKLHALAEELAARHAPALASGGAPHLAVHQGHGCC